MSVIIVLIIISVIVAVLFLSIFIWAVRSGQFDDTVSPSIRILFEDKKPVTPKNQSKSEASEAEDHEHQEGKRL